MASEAESLLQRVEALEGTVRQVRGEVAQAKTRLTMLAVVFPLLLSALVVGLQQIEKRRPTNTVVTGGLVIRDEKGQTRFEIGSDGGARMIGENGKDVFDLFPTGSLQLRAPNAEPGTIDEIDLSAQHSDPHIRVSHGAGDDEHEGAELSISPEGKFAELRVMTSGSFARVTSYADPRTGPGALAEVNTNPGGKLATNWRTESTLTSTHQSVFPSP